MNSHIWFGRPGNWIDPQVFGRENPADKLRIRGPMVGRLWVCYMPHTRKRATGMSPEQAYNAWNSYWGRVA